MSGQIALAMGVAALLAAWLAWRGAWMVLAGVLALLACGVAVLFLGPGTGNAYVLTVSLYCLPALGGCLAGGIFGAFLQRWFGQT